MCGHLQRLIRLYSKSRYFRNSASGTEAKTSDTSVLPWLEDDLSALQHSPLVPLVVPRDEKQKWSNQHHLMHTKTLSNYTLYIGINSVCISISRAVKSI